MVAFEFTGDNLPALAAILGAVGGLLAGWAAIIRARHEKDDECEERLMSTRKELGEAYDKWELERKRRIAVEEKLPNDLSGWGGETE